MKHASDNVTEKALSASQERFGTDGDVAVRGTVVNPEFNANSEEALRKTLRILDRLLWSAFTKRGRHEKDVR